MSLPLLAHYINAAHAANQQGQTAKAMEYSQLALAMAPGVPEAWFNLGIAQASLGQKPAAISSLEQARLRCMESAEGQNSVGLHLLELGALDTAEKCLLRAVELAPRFAYALSNLGNLYRKRGLLTDARDRLLAAREVAPAEPLLHVNLSGIYIDLKDYAQAEYAARVATQLAPSLPQAWINLSAALHKQHRLDDAETAARKALALAEQLPAAWDILGEVLVRQHRLEEAQAAFKHSIQLDPRSAQAWLSLGETYDQSSQYALAETAFRQSCELKPDSAPAWFKLGLALKDQKHHEEALSCLDKAYATTPHLDYLLSWKLMVQASVCEWTTRDQEMGILARDLRLSHALAIPFHLLAFEDDAALLLHAARRYTEHEHATTSDYAPQPSEQARRIRIGYFSADFRDHPVAQLIVDTLEQHDRSRFEVFGFSLGPACDTPLGQRIARAFEHFIGIHGLSDADALQLVRGRDLDIAINLSGYTAGHRSQLFAARVAPLQVSYLGYAGTMGAGYMDYLIADPVVCPPGSEAFYTEKLARLPHCFMPHDGQQLISEQTPSRHELGLPERGVVFCCFNNHHKITPEMFDVWMRLLTKVSGSVLWLSDGPDLMKKNLRREAAARGVAPERLVFAQRVAEMASHLARYRWADLFLDTLPYNAHTTASDALWAGVPVLTLAGNSFASRVAASLLHAIGLPDLVTDHLNAYETLALDLATNAAKLQSIRQRLVSQRDSCALFDTRQLVRSAESLYIQMHQLRLRGLPPAHITAEDVQSSAVAGKG